MKKLIAVLLILGFVVGAFAGCAQEEAAVPAATETTEEAASTEAAELIISTWGYNEDLFRKNVFEPFEQANNVKIILEVGNNSDRLNKIRAMEDSDVDVIFLAEAFAVQGIEEGLFETFDRSQVPNIEQIYEVCKAPHGEEYGPSYTVNRTGIIYDTAMVDFEVTSWSDLWNPAFETNLAIPEITTTAGPAMVVLAGQKAGVNALEDADAAFAELVGLKPNLMKIYGRSSEMVNMFAQGEIIGAVANDFAFGGVAEAVPTAVWVDPVEGGFVNRNTVNLVKGTDQAELAYKLIDFWLSEEVQKANALDKIDSPVNVNVELTEEESYGLTYGAELMESLQAIDSTQVNGVKAEWIDRWNREVAN